MKRITLNIAIIIILLISSFAFGYSGYQGLVIKEVKFEGLRFFTPQDLRENLQSIAGEKFSTYYINKDFKRLYSLGAFKDIKLFLKRTTDNKVIITFKVVEYPKIQEIILEGNDDLSSSKITDVMRMREDYYYNPAYIERDRKEIIELYKNEGFLHSKVRFEIQTGEENKVILKVIINEGEKVVIEQIRIHGCRYLDENLVRKFLESQETNLLLGDQTYSKIKKKNDIMRILTYARMQGFIFARVVRYDVVIDWVDPEFRDERGYYIDIEIEEGPRYTMGTVKFQGNELFTNKELKKRLIVKKGEIYNELSFKKSLQAIYDSYRTQGYIYTKITIIEQYDRRNKVINFVFNIFDGDRAHIETIVFRGNTKTKSYVLDRELRIWEGEIFNISRINLSKNRLNRLGYFKTVNMDIRPSSEEGLVDLIFTVEPQRTGMISFGGGYGTLSGFTVFTEVTENNFLGRGYRLSARGEYGQRAREIRVSFSSGYLGRRLPIFYKISAGLRWAKIQTTPLYDRNKDGVPDKLLYGESGNLILVQSRERAEDVGLSTLDVPNLTSNETIDGGSATYDLQFVSEEDFLGIVDYDGNGDFRLSSADNTSIDRYYRQYTIFSGLQLGFSFAEYFSVFSGYSFSASKLFGVNSSDDALSLYPTYKDFIDSTSPVATQINTYIYKNNIYDPTGNSSTSFRNTLINENWILSSRIPLGVGFVTVDNRQNPSKGIDASIVWSMVGFGGDVKYNGLDFEFKYYVRLPLGIVWANRISVGLIMPWFGNDKPLLLESQKYSFDGINETRGWQDYVYRDRYSGYGKVILSTELRIPIPATDGLLWWVFFFDGGGMNVDPKGKKVPLDLEKEYIFSWGFGLRIQIPMLPIRLYGAKRLLYKNGRLVGQGEGLEFVFSIAGYF